jgi:hypothetical protein
MRLHREGTPTLLLSTAVLCFALFAIWNRPWLPLWSSVLITVALCAVFAIIIWFFRVPTRRATAGEHEVLSPCDGKVVAIEEVEEPEYFNDKTCAGVHLHEPAERAHELRSDQRHHELTTSTTPENTWWPGTRRAARRTSEARWW